MSLGISNPFQAKPPGGAQKSAAGASAAQGAVKFAQQGSQGVNTQQLGVSGLGQAGQSKQAGKAAGGDQLDQFRQQMQQGGLNANPNKPALPYTATKGWSA